MEKLNLRAIYSLIAENKERQNTLAKILNLSSVSMNRKLKGKVPFTFDEVSLIAYHYNKEIKDLIYVEK